MITLTVNKQLIGHVTRIVLALELDNKSATNFENMQQRASGVMLRNEYETRMIVYTSIPYMPTQGLREVRDGSRVRSGVQGSGISGILTLLTPTPPQPTT
ncbi:hypothetical protein CBL_07280 [Carabus blaptoides fortunei]